MAGGFEAGLSAAHLVEGFDGVEVFLGAGKAGFGASEGFLGAFNVDFVAKFGACGEDADVVGEDFSPASADGDELALATVGNIGEFAWPEFGQQRGVLGEDAQGTVGARQDHFRNLLAEEQAFRRGDFEGEGAGHGQLAFRICSARSSTSSMVPCI